MNDLERAAHEYAERGWSVFWCRPGEKVPDTVHGFKDATTDHDQIRRWWTDRPDRNVAIATGGASIDVLDIDVRPGRTGYTAFHRLSAAGLLTGYSRVVSTPSGGRHVYFTGSGRAGGSVPTALVDFKAEGGYVLAPPSVVGGRPYTFEVDLPGPARHPRLGRRQGASRAACASTGTDRRAAAADADRPARHRPPGAPRATPGTRFTEPQPCPVLGRLPSLRGGPRSASARRCGPRRGADRNRGRADARLRAAHRPRPTRPRTCQTRWAPGGVQSTSAGDRPPSAVSSLTPEELAPMTARRPATTAAAAAAFDDERPRLARRDSMNRGGLSWDGPPTPLSARRLMPAFPVDVLPGWVADMVGAVH